MLVSVSKEWVVIQNLEFNKYNILNSLKNTSTSILNSYITFSDLYI